MKHAQELNLDESEMAVIYSSLGSICQDLQEWQASIDYFRREMSCRIGLGSKADVEVYNLNFTILLNSIVFLSFSKLILSAK